MADQQKMTRSAALGIFAVFFTQFVSFLIINARNIALPVMITGFDGMAQFAGPLRLCWDWCKIPRLTCRPG